MSAHPVPISAREPTPEEWSARVGECQALHEAVIGAVRGGREAMWKVAEAAYAFNEQSAWTALGYETKGEWLAQPEVNLSRSTFDRMVRVWRELAVRRRIDAPTLGHLDLTKVDVVLPSVTDHKTTIKDALSDAEVMPATDLREKYAGEHGGEVVGQVTAALGDLADGAPDRPEDDPDPDYGEVDDRSPDVLVEDWLAAIDAAWHDIDQALASRAPEPRLARDTLTALEFERLARKKSEPDPTPTLIAGIRRLLEDEDDNPDHPDQ